jgi:sugar phosphate isomerase/epimerase
LQTHSVSSYQIIEQAKIDTGDAANAWLESTKHWLDLCEKKFGAPSSIGVSCPGIARPDGSGILWMIGHMQSVENFDFQRHFQFQCPVPVLNEIAQCGYTAVELWVAHIDPAGMSDQRAATYKSILTEYGLTPIALTDALDEGTARVCQLLDIPMTAGGIAPDRFAEVRMLSRKTGIRVCHENHLEKSVLEIREKIACGVDGLGVAVDTGLLGTQGVDAPSAIAGLGSLIKYVHIKDVKSLGGHETVPLGEGCVNISGVIRELKAIGYDGVLSWEDEPEDRNPFEIAIEMHMKINAMWEQAS